MYTCLEARMRVNGSNQKEQEQSTTEAKIKKYNIILKMV
jgi:hypothetical protein